MEKIAITSFRSKMKRIVLSILLLVGSLTSYGQTDKEKDSLINEICKTVKETKNLSDSAVVFFVYEKHLTPFLLNYSEEQRDEVLDAIYFRLLKICPEFHDILNRINPPKGDWKAVTGKPKTQLNKKTCRHFLEHKKYFYLESNGDTVNLSIDNGFWIDKFKDGTYSKLIFDWINDCEFDIEFVESDNIKRKNFSKRGDKYRYQILNKNEHYYLMSVAISGTDRYMTFRLYY
jgi:hypothetical protein